MSEIKTQTTDSSTEQKLEQELKPNTESVLESKPSDSLTNSLDAKLAQIAIEAELALKELEQQQQANRDRIQQLLKEHQKLGEKMQQTKELLDKVSKLPDDHEIKLEILDIMGQIKQRTEEINQDTDFKEHFTQIAELARTEKAEKRPDKKLDKKTPPANKKANITPKSNTKPSTNKETTNLTEQDKLVQAFALQAKENAKENWGKTIFFRGETKKIANKEFATGGALIACNRINKKKYLLLDVQDTVGNSSYKKGQTFEVSSFGALPENLRNTKFLMYLIEREKELQSTPIMGKIWEELQNKKEVQQ